jgi:PAS domain S-box-containing protein
MVKLSTRDLYRQIVEHAGLAIFLVDQEGRRIFANDVAIHLSGRSRDELERGRFADSLVPEDRERALSAFKRCIDTGEPVHSFVTRWIRNGEIRYGAANWAPIKGDNGQIACIQVTLMDITELVQAKDEIQHSQELYRSLIEAVGSPVIRVNREGKRSFVNDHAVHFHGMPRETLQTGYFQDCMHPEDAEKASKLLRETIEKGQPVYGFVTRQSVKGETRHISANWVPIRDSQGSIVEVQMTSTDVTDVVRLREQLELFGIRIRKAHEEERLSISRVLHDDTIQTLIALSNTVQRLLASEHSPDQTRKELEHIRTVLLDQVDALRRLSVTLRPALLDRMGLDAAIRWFTRQACEPKGIKWAVRIGEGWKRLNPSVEIRLFRIAQEAVNNAVRHGEPKNITVSLGIDDGALDLRIEDDGKGFTPTLSQMELLQQGRLGLVGMLERARALGAVLTIDARPGAGTRLHLQGTVARMEEAA